MTWVEILCLALPVAGMCLLLIGYLQSHRKIRKDSGFGIKTWQTRASEEAWYAGNVAAAPYSYAQGVICIVLGPIGFFLGSPDNIIGGICILLAVILVLVATGFQVSRANAAAEHADGQNTP